jgi:hypothetical protein
MRSLVKLGLTLTLLGGPVLAPAIISPQSAVALPEQEALKKLERIPVFVIMNQDNVPLIADIADPKDKTKKIQVMNFFMSPQDAQSLMSGLQTKQPDLAKNMKVVTATFRDAYDFKLKNKIFGYSVRAS